MLTLRKVTGHPHADNAYRVIYDGIDVGYVGLKSAAEMRFYWGWGIDTILPRQAFATEGQSASRDEAMAAFRSAWEQFIADPERLAYFMEMKRKRL